MRLILLLILSSLFLSCTQEVHRITHGPVGDTQIDFEQSPEVVSQLVLEQNAMYRDALATDDSNELLQKVILPIKRDYFDSEMYLKPDLNQQQSFIDLLGIYNEAILRVNSKNPELLKENSVLDHYKGMLDRSCDENLEGGCENIRLLAMDPSSRKVAVAIATAQDDVISYYRYLMMAMDMSNRTRDQELDFYFIKRAQEYGRLLAQQPEAFPQWSLTRLSRVFHNILIDFKGADPNSVSYREFIDNFNPWEFSRHGDDLFKESAQHLIDQASRYYLYEDEQVNQLLVDTIDRQMDLENEGIRFIIEDIQGDGDLAKTLENLELTKVFPANEYFYIVDRLFNDHMTIDQASKFWRNTNKDKEAIIQVVTDYVEVQVVYMIIKTNRRMRSFFDNSERYADSLVLLRRAVNETLNLHTQWDSLLNNRIRRLRTFLDRQFKRYGSASLIQNDPYQLLEGRFESLSQNIKYLAVYPNMMMLIYLMAKEKFRGEIQTFWGTYVIDPALIIGLFLDGNLSPWFSFGNNKVGLNQMQLLYAFHFALTTEIFSTFSNNKRIPIDYDSFFKAFIEEYFQKEITAADGLVDKVSKFNSFLTQNSKDYRDLELACGEERRFQADELAHLMDSGDYEFEQRSQTLFTDIDSLTQYVSMGTITTSGTYFKLINEFYRGQSLTLQIRKIRTHLQKKIIHMKHMINMVAEYEKKEMPGLMALFKQIEDLQASLIRSTHQMHLRLDGCDHLLVKREYMLQNALIRKEREFMAKVYDDIIELRVLQEKNALSKLEGQEKSEKISSLQSSFPSIQTWDGIDDDTYNRLRQEVLDQDHHKLSDTDFPDGIRNRGFRGKVTERIYEFRKFDMLVRMKSYLKDVYPQLRVMLPDFDTWSVLTSSDVDPVRVDFTLEEAERKEDFIKRGLSFFFSKLDWYEQTTNVFFFKSKLEMLAELYKMSPYSLTPGACEDLDASGCMNVTSADIVEEGFKVLNLLNLDQFDIENLQWTGTHEKYPVSALLDEFIMEKKSKRKLPLFDKIFHLIISDDPDFTKVETLWLDEAVSYYETETSLVNFFFKPSSEIKVRIKSEYLPKTIDYARKAQQFMDTLNSYRIDPKYQISEFKINLEESVVVDKETITVSGTTVEAPIYISTTKLSDFTSQLTTVNDSTDGQFLPAEFGGKYTEEVE